MILLAVRLEIYDVDLRENLFLAELISACYGDFPFSEAGDIRCGSTGKFIFDSIIKCQ